jgi:hypothetical protein
VTERWRKKLEGIDQVGPGQDVFDRAKRGPTLPEPQSPMQRTSTRVVTAIAAFVVFALAISLFAIPALRLGSHEPVVAGGGQLQPLWPWSSIEAVQAWRDDPQPIGATGVDHFSSPDEVAAAFGREVIGWTEVYPHEEGTALISPSLVSPCNPSIPGAFTCSNTAGSAPPTMALYTPSTSASAFRTFDLSTCPPNAVCDSFGAPASSIKVVVYQPLGSDGPWAVLEAKTDYMSISLDAGTQLRDGSTAYASGLIPTGEHAVLGYHATADGCGTYSGTTGFERVPNDTGSDQAGSITGVTYSRGQLQLTLPPQGDPCVHQLGYVFVMITDQPLPTTDPLLGLPITSGVLGFAAVPVTFDFLSQQAGSPPPSSTPPSPIGAPTHGYTDPLGWTIDVPDGWITHPFDASTNDESWEGAWFGTGEPVAGASGDPNQVTAGPDDVLLVFARHEHKGVQSPRDDSTFPLNFKQLAPVDGGLSLELRADGLPFTLAVRVGSGGLTPAQESNVEQMISSISFQPWTAGETRNGWLALGPTSDDDQKQQDAKISWQSCDGKGCYVLVYGDYGPGGSGPYVLGPIQPCGEGEDMTADPASVFRIVLVCPDGTKQAWGAPGEPAPTNSPGYDHALNPYPVIHAWDGTLLTNVQG